MDRKTARFSLPLVKHGLVVAACVALAASASGCGPVWYTGEIISAESIVSEAQHADAAELSAYEYYLAREYLDKAREQAAEASYEDAIHYAQEAHRAGELARDQARASLRRDDSDGRR